MTELRCPECGSLRWRYIETAICTRETHLDLDEPEPAPFIDEDGWQWTDVPGNHPNFGGEEVGTWQCIEGHELDPDDPIYQALEDYREEEAS